MRDDLFPALNGTILERKYRVDRVVAEGGFGVVYAGRHLILDVPIAIKALKPAASTDRAAWSEHLLAFLEEAKTIAKLHHPNIVKVLDAGATDMAGAALPVPWMVLEWLDGVTLRDELIARRGRGLAPDACMALLRPVLAAIAGAHDAGVVHRDIKASNVMLVPAGGALVAKVLDFGIAKIMELDEQHLAPSGHTGTDSFGRAFTPASAAPEQLSGTRTGPWTDVFALGLLLTEVLAGRPPFSIDDANEHYRAVFDPVRPTPAKFGVDVGAWEAVLVRALAIQPGARQPNARALAQELEEALPRAVLRGATPLDDAPSSEPSSAPPSAPPSAELEALESRFAGTHRSARRRKPPADRPPSARAPRAAEPRRASRAALALLLTVVAITLGVGIGLTAGARRGDAPRLIASRDPAAPIASTQRFVERRLTSLDANLRLSPVALSHDHTRVAFSFDGALWVQQIASGERAQIAAIASLLPGAAQCQCSLDWLPGDREIVVGALGQPLEAIDVDTKSRRTVRKQSGPFRLSPDGARVAILDPAYPGVRIERLGGPLDTILLPSVLPQRVSDLAWAPSGKWLALVLQGPQAGRGAEELVVASLDGARMNVVARGTLMTNDGATAVAWSAEDRLLFLRPALRGGGVTLMELHLSPNGEPIGEPVALHRSQSDWSSLAAAGGALAFVMSDVQDDVFVAELAPSGTALTRPFERATNSDASDSVIGWASARKFVFLSNRGNAKGIGVLEQEVGGAPALLGSGPDIYTTGAVVLTEEGHALFWRGGPGADPPRPCELVRIALEDGHEDVVATGVSARPDGDAALTCRARIACAAGKCAAMGTASVGWLDLEHGERRGRFSPPSLESAGPASGLAVSRDGRIAVVTEREPSSESQVTVLRRDGAVDVVVASLHMTAQVISFALDGRHIYATDYADGAAGLVSIDLAAGTTRRLVDRDSRWRANPRVAPDGKRIAITVRSRQMNIGYLEPDPSP